MTLNLFTVNNKTQNTDKQWLNKLKIIRVC